MKPDPGLLMLCACQPQGEEQLRRDRPPDDETCHQCDKALEGWEPKAWCRWPAWGRRGRHWGLWHAVVEPGVDKPGRTPVEVVEGSNLPRKRGKGDAC